MSAKPDEPELDTAGFASETTEQEVCFVEKNSTFLSSIAVFFAARKFTKLQTSYSEFGYVIRYWNGG